jgi:hypothetical protein
MTIHVNDSPFDRDSTNSLRLILIWHISEIVIDVTGWISRPHQLQWLSLHKLRTEWI